MSAFDAGTLCDRSFLGDNAPCGGAEHVEVACLEFCFEALAFCSVLDLFVDDLPSEFRATMQSLQNQSPSGRSLSFKPIHAKWKDAPQVPSHINNSPLSRHILHRLSLRAYCSSSASKFRRAFFSHHRRSICQTNLSRLPAQIILLVSGGHPGGRQGRNYPKRLVPVRCHIGDTLWIAILCVCHAWFS